MSFVARRSEETRRYLFYFFAALSAAIALITVVIAQLSWRGWVQGLRALLRGEGILRPARASTAPELRPIARDLRELIRDLERQYRPLDGSQRIWDQQALRATLRSELHGNDVIVVANREPYIHTRTAEGIRLQHPASGLVTALEPVMRACSGTWIAHGSGSADRETVDRSDRIAVPPEHPIYQLRRIWLTKEEEAGYYAGFANEGLWPLCHIAHVRPTFRSSDFEYYRTVNTRFADAVAAESQTKDPVVLVQDYHFALLPKLIRERLPEATIITFWHIPWPNPESFAICPWRIELLEGLLGSSIIGFHTQFHCNNFLDTVDRLLEARVDRESFTIARAGQTTAVHRYPISIEWPPAPLANATEIPEARRAVRERLGLPSNHMLGIGIDRLDYTKGIIERFNAVARLLEMEPRWIGRFSFVQIAAPSRSTIDDYRDYAAHVRARAAEINKRLRRREARADHSPRRASRARLGLRAPSRRRPVLREQPARRDESRRQGIRRRARRRAGRADPVAVHRRLARAGRSADRQSLRRRPVRGGAAPCVDDARRRAARAHAIHARRRPRVQRLSVGGPDAARRRGDAAARANPHDRGHGAPWLTTARRRKRRDAESRARARAAPRPASALTAHCALFLDIDGTLLDLASTPDRVRVDADITALLPELAEQLCGAVALITGRAIADADRLFPGLALPVAGQHGLERRAADGSIHLHEASMRGLERLRRELARFATRHPGLLLEDKGATLALHYRRAPEPRGARPSDAAHDAAHDGGQRRMAAATGQEDPRNQAGRPRQGNGDPRIHGGAAVRGSRARIRRR